MNYEECREKYATYTRSLDSKKSQLQEKEKEIEAICSEYDNVSSIYVSTKEKLEKSKNDLNDYIKKKFSKSIMKLFGTLVPLSVAIAIIIGFTSNYGFVASILCGPALLIAYGMILGIYSFIQEAIPEFIQRFWKKDETFIELKELVKTKEKELSIAETNKNIISDKIVRLRKIIKNLEGSIDYIENDIKELMLAFAPTLFSEEFDEQNKTQEKHYTRIRKPENQN